MKLGPQMTMSRKIEVVRAVLNKSKGLKSLHGEKLVNHISHSITLYEKYITPKEDNGTPEGTL
jgi:hypothetical protein